MSSTTVQRRTNSLAFAKTDCHTCAAQRRKCDRRRPRCSPCLSDGIVCGGFPMQLSWSRRKPAAAPREARIGDEAEDPFHLEPLSLKMAARSRERDRRQRSKPPPRQFKFVANESSSRKRPSSPPRPSQEHEAPIQTPSQHATPPETSLADLPSSQALITPGRTSPFEQPVIHC